MANNVRAWSTTAGSNGTADADINCAEGCPPSAVNDAERQMMAKIKNTLIGVEYLDHGYTATFATTTTFASPGDLTAIYLASRRLKFDCGTTLYGTIRSASYVAANTTVTMVMDNSTTLSSSLSAVYIGSLAPTNPSAPATFDKNNYTLTAGSSTAYTLTPTPGLAALDNGTRIRLKFHTANGAAPTLAVSGLTAKTMVGPGNATLSGSEFPADTTAAFVYDSSLDVWQAEGTPASVTAASQSAVDTGTATTSYVSPSTLLNAAWQGSALDNRIINPEGAVFQRSDAGAVGTTDNSYIFDRWRLLLGAANAATASQITSSLTNGASYAMRLTVGSGNNNKFGMWQVIEGVNCKDLQGKKVVVAARIKATSGLSDIRMALVEFTGTEDSVSGDPISAWNSAATNPTLAANYAFVNAPANMSVGTSYAQFTVTGTVSSSAVNLAVFIWNDDTSTTQTTDQLEVTQVELKSGIGATPYKARPYSLELQLCQRYFNYKSAAVLGNGYTSSASVAKCAINTGVRMRTETATLSQTSCVIRNVGGSESPTGISNVGWGIGATYIVDMTSSGAFTNDRPVTLNGGNITLNCEL